MDLVVLTGSYSYFPLWLFPILYIGSKLYYRQPIVKASEMDFVSNIAEIEADW